VNAALLEASFRIADLQESGEKIYVSI
jgi:hypothetical protein